MISSSRFKKEHASNVDMLPVMNLFSILIPFLVTVAVFQKMAIVDVHLPEQNEQAKGGTVITESLGLTISITKDYLQVLATNGGLPKIFTHEKWKVRCRNDNQSRIYDANAIRREQNQMLCEDGSLADKHDIQEIMLQSLEKKSEKDPGRIKMAVYNSENVAIINEQMELISDPRLVGDGRRVSALGSGKFSTLSSAGVSELRVAPRSAYDDLEKILRDIAFRYSDANDINDVVVVASDDIAFDKIIQIMDRARVSGFHQISLAKLAE
jgi:biopolymer transport protein ExbD